mmetsp:Transcript_6265/g.9369  ORF Transcript_6265/g.9369 Transcript_6265/m.9369 type:complete len:204 (+) Transcript_6265:308-919(+)
MASVLLQPGDGHRRRLGHRSSYSSFFVAQSAIFDVAAAHSRVPAVSRQCSTASNGRQEPVDEPQQPEKQGGHQSHKHENASRPAGELPEVAGSRRGVVGGFVRRSTHHIPLHTAVVCYVRSGHGILGTGAGAGSLASYRAVRQLSRDLFGCGGRGVARRISQVFRQTFQVCQEQDSHTLHPSHAQEGPPRHLLAACLPHLPPR